MARERRLSPTPDSPFSRGCSPRQFLPRLLVWAVFTYRPTQQSFLFATTHVDNNAPCQTFSANLIASRLQVSEVRMNALEYLTSA